MKQEPHHAVTTAPDTAWSQSAIHQFTRM